MLDDNVPQPWRARTTLVLTLTLVAVGLGNLQRLPYLIGEYGGGVFFLAYLASVMLLSVPILIAEIVLGSLGRGSPGLAMHWAASAANVDSRWRHLALLQAFLGLIMAAMAALMAAWCFRWAVLIFEGDLAAASAIDVSKIYLEHIKDGPSQFLGSLALVVITGSLSALGVRLGMGFLAWVVLPIVAITLLGVLDFIFLYTDLRSVSEFLFARDLSAWRLDAMWIALSSAGITLGAGLGVGMALGAQSPPGLPWGRSILAVAVLDTAFMIVTAVIVCAALFEVNVAPAEGLATVFIGLAYAFANLPLGETYGALFYFSMACIAAGATVILVEPTVLVIGRDWGAGRLGGSILAHTLIALVVAFCLFFDAAILANLATLTVNWLIPASLLAMSLFVGWLMPRPVLRGELYREPLWLFWLWWRVLRWLVPPVCAAWLIRGLL
ncbi:hypothetical protein PQZ11_01605 [Luminiphilus sp.]|nr:hypothetical protein [Luminiphilus sp.]MDC6471733.1 hypothetical protein [Luminiphilus sp.]